MKKISLVLLMFLSVFTIAGCNNEEVLEITPESLITMENLDDYMFRDDVQYVDLRNSANTLKYGYIYGFENIPFFEYLDYRAFNRERTYEFNPDQILDEGLMRKFFEEEKAIFLYADGCIRAGYVKDVLNHLGYERVFVIGGYYEYHGDNVIRGDGTFEMGNSFYNSYTDTTTGLTYVMYGNFDVAFNVQYLRFDIFNDEGISIRYSSEVDYNSMLTILEEYIDVEIYNFNEIVEDAENNESELYNLVGLDWTELTPIINLLREQYR